MIFLVSKACFCVHPSSLPRVNDKHENVQARKACNAAGVSQPCDLAALENKDKQETVKAAVSYVTTLMAEDRKSTGLKSLQVFLPADALL